MGYVIVDGKVINVSNKEIMKFIKKEKDEEFITQCRELCKDFNKNK